MVLYWQVLFNDTIFHNIHYGRLSAKKDEVYDEHVFILWIIWCAHSEILNLLS